MNIQPIKTKDGKSMWQMPSSDLKIEQYSRVGAMRISNDKLQVGMNVKVSFVDGINVFSVKGTVAEYNKDDQTFSLISRSPAKSMDGQCLTGFEIDMRRYAFRELDNSEVERLANDLTNNREALERSLDANDRASQQIDEQEDLEIDDIPWAR